MFKNLSNYLFLTTLISGTLISISSNSWLGAWIGLEINLLSFIPLMIDTNNLLSTEASLKYFLTQALASAIFLFSSILFILQLNVFSMMSMNSNFITLIILSSLLLKSGAAPFHFWFPGVMEGLNWWNNLILMTWQKIAPLMLTSYCLNFNFIINIIILSIMIGSLGGLNQTSLRKLMAFSSINHLGWMLAAMIYSENLWLSYFFIYTYLSFTIIFIFNLFNFFHLNQMFSFYNQNPLVKFSLFISLLSLGGLPPFLGFLPKWMVIQSISNLNAIFLLIVMVSFTLITLYFYMRITYSAFMLSYMEINWNYKNFTINKNMNWTLLLNFFSSMSLTLISLLYLFM
uniref:NADH-ubiquinone oxidoreductase chain 2 n=1 Tax=Simulium aureohirtum TaxID=154798 RepID=A0A126FA46_9DIPT|nr:NADH dehydrogenase subunit 2 [Simulium aureohirtum]AKN23373.1 NADH dehydrogenase subunit 2 [Simulium aureohirtum]